MNSQTELSQHKLSPYQSVLPVQIIESIPNDSASLSAISVNLLENGWAWLVCGRRLFVWHYKQTSNRFTTCYELQLPASDVAHKASLVCLLFGQKVNVNQMPSVLAVSPEGTIRYWANVACESNCFETNATELQGQECHLLTGIQPHGCILGTTTSSLMHIFVHSTSSSILTSQPITCRLLKIPQGIFAGIKKFSTFIFGGVPGQQGSDSRSLIKILKGTESHVGVYLYTFAGLNLQIWEVSKYADRFVTEYDLDRSLRVQFLAQLWRNDGTHPDQLQIWIIDAITTEDNQIVLLVVCLNQEISENLYFTLVSFNVDVSNLLNISSAHQQQQSPSFESFTVLKNLAVVHRGTDFLNYRLLTQTSADNLFYVYNNVKMICVHLGNDVVDSINFDSFGNEILGAGVCDGHPLVLTSKDSLLSIEPNQKLLSPAVQEYLVEEDSIESEGDNFGWIRKSFNLYRKNETQKCQLLIRDNFNAGTQFNGDELDSVIVQLSTELCNGVPKSDPRWAESLSLHTNEQLVSVYLANQLEEKLNVHCQLIEFLKNIGIWNKLTVHSSQGRLIPTQLLLCEHAEKLVAANAFKRLHEEYGSLLDNAIRTVLENRHAVIPENLTAQDVFYRELTCIDELIPVLFEYESEYIGSNQALPKDTFELIIATSIIFITVFHEVFRFRQERCAFYESGNGDNFRFKEYIHWSAGTGKNGIRSILLSQVDMLIKYCVESKLRPGIASVDEVQVRSLVYQKLIDLTDIILDGYVCQLRSLDSSSERYKVVQQEFENDRTKCIRPLLKAGQHDRAIALAEKYEDFDTLVRVCETIGQNKRLDRYLVEFKEKGFSDFLFKWYLREGKQGKMMTIGSPLLGNFLENHPDLRWLYLMNTGQFDLTSRCLLSLAEQEDKFVQRKKTLLSLSKLSALTTKQTDMMSMIEKINQEHDLINYQEQLVDIIGGEDKQLQRPLDTKQLIQLFIDASWRPSDKQILDEHDFKCALELSRFLRDDCREYHDIRRQIIANLIIQDSWTGYDPENPMNYLQKTLFYRLINLSYSSGDDFTDYLPSCDELLSWSELDQLPNRKDFSYLIKIAYEKLVNVL